MKKLYNRIDSKKVLAMTEQVYNWKRFWCLRSQSISLGDDGYLHDPDEKWGKLYNPHLVTFEEISHLQCLALLGEPGIGKTMAIKVQKEEISRAIKEQESQILWLDLRSISSEDRLIQKIFKSPQFIAGLNETSRVHIFLDSFDECLLKLDTLANILVDEFEEYRTHIKQFYLRITCRTAIWPTLLEKGLQDIWGRESVGVYELTPLRRIDVIERLKSEKINADAFLKEIQQKNIISLAIKPITLNFLINSFNKYGSHFGCQRLYQLYLDGCSSLCEESNDSRRASSVRGKLDVEQRLIVAARIAVVTIFANRFAIWTGRNLGNVPEEDILLEKLCPGYETAHQREFEITTEVIEEVLDTSLFSSRGLDRMGFAHQTYAEFLAAWYLFNHETPLEQVMTLIAALKDPESRLIPQLYETAAWLASMRDDVLQEIIKTDPDVLLQSDIPTDAKIRAAIVEKLLKQYEDGKLGNFNGHGYQQYNKLKHPGLAEQLHPYVQNISCSIEARNTAIDIVKGCNLHELQDDLVNVAIDGSQPLEIRINATTAVCLVGDSNTRARLKPLAVGNLTEDDSDRLKGWALKAVWAEHLTAQELFNALTPPKKSNLFGGYQFFIEYELIQNLQPKDLVVALHWLEKQGTRYFRHPFESLADDLVLKSWEHLLFPGVVESFAKAALIQWKSSQELITNDSDALREFNESLMRENEKRLLLIEKILELLVCLGSKNNILWGYIAHKIIQVQDITWMIEKANKATPEKIKIIVKMIKRIFDWNKIDDIDTLLVATQSNVFVKNEFADYFEPVALDSERADRMRTHEKEMQEWESRPKQLGLLAPPPRERVIQCLDQLESGNLESWWQLNQQMTLKPNSQCYEAKLESDLTILPGWEEADTVTRKRIINGAKKYIQEYQPVVYDWRGTGTYECWALAGCSAFQLILKEDLEFLQNFSSEVWQRWASVIAGFPHSNPQQESYKDLVKQAYQNASLEILDTVTLLIDRQNHKYGDIFSLEQFDWCWDDNFKNHILEKAKDSALKPDCMGKLLKKLVEHQSSEATIFLQYLVSLPLPLKKNDRQKAVIAAQVLVESIGGDSWAVVWSTIQQDTDFGRQVFEAVAYPRTNSVAWNLTETQLADLYIWLVQQYPYEEDPDDSRQGISYFLGVRDCIATLRDNILSQLVETGTPQACLEIQRIAKQFPKLAWLRTTFLNAQNVMRRKTWQPLKPEQILQMINKTLKYSKPFISPGVIILENPNNPIFNFNAPVGGVNSNSVVNGDQIGIQQSYALDHNFAELLSELSLFVNDLQQKYPTATEEDAHQILQREFQALPNTQPLRWKQLLNLKRLWNGTKKAGFKITEHFTEENPWGKGIIAFFEGYSDPTD
jgi:predicted NACHT family NTPase